MLLLIAALAHAELPAPCGTAALHHQRERPGRVAYPTPPPDHKPTRDAISQTWPHMLETENFAIKWGNQGDISQADAQVLADAFETAWALEIDDMGFPEPVGASEYRFNVYIGDTDLLIPSANGNAGYFWYDEEGWPMVVMGADTSRRRGSAEVTAAHEFLHALQASVNTYQYDGAGDWWFEATASWVEEEAFPENSESAGLFFGFAFLPEVPVNYFSYPSSGAVDEFHQYGAFVFPRYIGDTYGRQIIVDSWLRADFDTRPLNELNRLLDDDISDVFFAFADTNATWDYDKGEHYKESLEIYDYLDNHRPSGRLDIDGGWVEPVDFWPETYGANYWEIEPTDLPARFDISGDSGPTWHASIVTRTGDSREIYDLDASSGFGLADVSGLDTVDEAWMVIAAADTTDRDAGWSYPYEVRMREQPEGIGVCGCSSGSSGGPWLLIAALLLSRRRASQPLRQQSRSAPYRRPHA